MLKKKYVCLLPFYFSQVSNELWIISDDIEIPNYESFNLLRFRKRNN